MMQEVKFYFTCLLNPNFFSTGIKVALVVGSLLFAINHGSALLNKKMTFERWISACLTYLVPYCVNIHGQYISQAQQRNREMLNLRSSSVTKR